MLEGGFPMFFLLAFGVAALISAARYARFPGRRRLRLTLALALATGFTTLTATCADISAVGHHAHTYLRAHPETTMTEVLLQGLAESMSPGILGFTLLSLVALIASLGIQREAMD
jgi:hypothetical protein